MIPIKPKICIIGQFPPPIHGLSKALDTLYNSRLSIKYKFSMIDLTKNWKFLFNLMNIVLNRSQLYYLTISQTKFGNLRDLCILFILLLKRKKIIIHLHGGYYGRLYESDMGIVMRFLNRILLSNVNKAIVLSESLKNSFEGILPKHKIEIVSNCIDDEIFISEYEFDEKLQSIDCLETVNILFLSNMIESKGYRTVLEISKICKENRLEEYRFIFAGGFFSKADEEYFFDFTKKHQLSETVEYKGIVTGLEKRELLRGSHVFILPTNYNKEGQPISIIEAMADGMCIITTKHAGIPDLVTDRENGFLVPYGDYKKMYDKIREISSDRGKLKEIYLNNRDKVKKYFLQEHYIKNLEKLFDDELI